MWPFRFAMHRKRGLRMMVVSLLSSSPKNGVEVMDGIESMTRGWWRPTPGSIYPLLTRMTEEGTLKKRDDGRYELTSSARREFEYSLGQPLGRPNTSEDLLGQAKSLVSHMEDVGRTEGKLTDKSRNELKELARRLSRLAGDDEESMGDSG